MSQGVSFTAIDFSVHPEMIQIDGHNLFALTYQCKHAKLYTAYDSIKRSLDRCLGNAAFVDAHRNTADDPFVSENLFAHSTSMIVNYGRCFASGRVKFERKDVPAKHHKTHDELINLRNDYVAHSGGSGEAVVNLIALYPNSQNKKIVKIDAPRLVSVNYINIELWVAMREIVLHLRSLVDKKLAFHYKAICDQISAIDINKLYEEFKEFDLKGMEYSPTFTPGDYDQIFEIKSNGLMYVKAIRKVN